MAAPITGEMAILRKPGTRTPARGGEGFPSRRSRARPGRGARATRRGEPLLWRRYPTRPETRE